MQIKHKVLRAAAAAAVAAFMSTGAVAPVHADDADEQAGSSTGTQTSQERRADQTDRSGDTRVDAEEDTSSEEHGDEAGQQTAEPDATEGDDTEAGEETSSPGTTCDQLGYTKFDRSNGSEELEFGTLDWAGDTLTYVIHEGYTVDLCIKSGVKDPITEFTVTGVVEGSEQIAQDISHIGYVMTEEAAEGAQPEETQEETQEEEETTVAPEADGTCPEDATMNAEGECVIPATEIAAAESEVAGAEAETATEVLGVQAERASTDEAALAPASGILPATGAGDYALIILAGVGLLGAGGVLLARRRAQVDG